MANIAQRLANIAPTAQTVQTVRLPFGEWLPDLAALGNPGVTNVNNLIPYGSGYRPLPALAAYSTSTLTARCQGATAAQDANGNTWIYAGDATALYRLLNGTFTDVSKVGGYNVPVDDQWEFTQYTNTLIATNINDPVQSVSVGGSLFADLITTSTLKPKARHCAVVRDFLVLGNTSDATDGAQPQRVWWSALDDITDFDPDATTQCDFNDQHEGGWVQRIIGGAEYGMIVQERSISRMTYVGTPLIFQIDPIDRQRGSPIPGSIIGWGRLVFWISDEGFFSSDGQQSYPIGQNKVDHTFWDQFDFANFGRVSAAIDPINKLVMWTFPGTGSTGGNPNKVFIYNWVEGKWSQADIVAYFLVRLATQGYTLEELDQFSTSMETLTPSLDSRQWSGGEARMAAFGSDNKLYFFTGGNLQAVIETSEIQPIAGRRSRVSTIRPLVDTTSVAISVASRVRDADAVSYGASVTIDSDGEGYLQSEGRYHRVRLSISSSVTWTHALAVEVNYVPEGNR